MEDSIQCDVDLGLRYDLQRVPPPPCPNTFTPLLTLYTSTLNLDKNNIAPRIGVAWQIDSKTVLRAGYGIFFHGKTSNSTYYALRVENGVYQITYTGSPAQFGLLRTHIPQRLLHSAWPGACSCCLGWVQSLL